MLLPNDVSPGAFSRQVTIYAEVRGEELPAPVHEGDVLGEVTVYYNGQSCGTVKLVANTSIDLQRVRYIELQIGKALSNTFVKLALAVIFLMIVVYIALVIRYNKIRRAKQRKRISRRRGPRWIGPFRQ